MATQIEGIGKVTSMRNALDKLERFGKRIVKIRDERKEQVELGVGVMAIAAGGAAVGAARSKFGEGPNGEIDFMGLPADAVAAAALVGAGVTGMAGKYSHAVAMLGAGAGAGVLAFETKKALDARK